MDDGWMDECWIGGGIGAKLKVLDSRLIHCYPGFVYVFHFSFV